MTAPANKYTIICLALALMAIAAVYYCCGGSVSSQVSALSAIKMLHRPVGYSLACLLER